MSRNYGNRFRLNPMYSIWGICGVFAIGFTYSFAVYFLGFFCFANREKLIVFCGLSFLMFSVLLVLIKIIYPQSANFLTLLSKKQKLWAILLVTGFSILVFFVSLPYIPSVISLEITIPKNSHNQYNILEINKLGSINQKQNRISPYKISTEGNWIIENNSLSISSAGGESLKYIEAFKQWIKSASPKSPDSGKVKVSFNGISQIINLQNSDYDLIVVDLPFSYFKMSPDRVFWVFILLFSNFISLIFLFFLILTIFYLYQDFRAVFEKTSVFQKVNTNFYSSCNLLRIR